MPTQKQTKPIDSGKDSEKLDNLLHIYHMLGRDSVSEDSPKTHVLSYGPHRLALRDTYPNLYACYMDDVDRRRDLFELIYPMQTSFIQRSSFYEDPHALIALDMGIVRTDSSKTTGESQSSSSLSESRTLDEHSIKHAVDSAFLQEQIRLLWLDHGSHYLQDKYSESGHEIQALQNLMMTESMIAQSRQDSDDERIKLSGDMVKLDQNIRDDERQVARIRHDIDRREPVANGISDLAEQRLVLSAEERARYDADLNKWATTLDQLDQRHRLEQSIQALTIDCAFADDIMALINQCSSPLDQCFMLRRLVQDGDFFSVQKAPELVKAIDDAIARLKDTVRRVWDDAPQTAKQLRERNRLQRLSPKSDDLEIIRIEAEAKISMRHKYPQSILKQSRDALLSDEYFGLSLLSTAVDNLKLHRDNMHKKIHGQTWADFLPELPHQDDYIDYDSKVLRLQSIQSDLNKESRQLQQQLDMVEKRLVIDRDRRRQLMHAMKVLDERIKEQDRDDQRWLEANRHLITDAKDQMRTIEDLRDNLRSDLALFEGLDDQDLLARDFCETMKKIDWYFTPERIGFLANYCFQSDITVEIDGQKGASHDDCLRAIIAEVRNQVDKESINDTVFITSVEKAYLMTLLQRQLSHRKIKFSQTTEHQHILNDIVLTMARYIPKHTTVVVDNVKAIISHVQDVESLHKAVLEYDKNAQLGSTKLPKKRRLSSRVRKLIGQSPLKTEVRLEDASNQGKGQLRDTLSRPGKR